jgi:hypothetical protein
VIRSVTLRGSVQEIGCKDLKIIVRSVRKSAGSVAVAERPDARDVGTQLIVHSNISVVVTFQTEVIGIRCAPHRQQ